MVAGNTSRSVKQVAVICSLRWAENGIIHSRNSMVLARLLQLVMFLHIMNK